MTEIKLFGTRIVPSAPHDEKNEQEQEARDAKAVATAVAGLPCPRCKSRETKFCYFNNYNMNQPRHFCRGCQRYWTAGGALRNVPVGAGRRKVRSSLHVEAGMVVYQYYPPPSGGVAMQQWLLHHQGFPSKRHNGPLETEESIRQ